jgi:hypothetical protein
MGARALQIAARWLAALSRFDARRRLAAWLRTTAAVDTAVCLLYLAFAAWIGHGLWPHPSTRALADNPNDQILNEWFLGYGVNFWTGDFDLVTHRLNAPDGINLMSNASIITDGIAMAPVTALFGASTSFAVLVVLNLAATAAGWYLLFARGLGRDRVAAAVGGLFAGFAPGMLSQSNSHLHIASQWLVPPIVWCMIKLARAGVRLGGASGAARARVVVPVSLGLAALICAQALLGEEVLYLTALTLLLFGVAYAVLRRGWVRRAAGALLAGLALAASVSGLVLLYPLWIQLSGAQHTPNAPFEAKFFYADLASYWTFSPLSIGGSPDAMSLATGPTELNAFLGLPLILLVVGLVIGRRRSPAVLAAATTVVVMAYLSLGVSVILDGRPTGLPSLYNVIAKVPVIDAALPTRYSLALIPLISVILVDAIGASRSAAPVGRRSVGRFVLGAATALALVPLFPNALPATHRDPVPAFISSGAWRQCVPEHGVLVPVPLPTPTAADTMRWAAAANDAFAIPEGFFLAAYAPGGRASVGTFKQPTSKLLADVATTGVVPTVTDDMRARARADLAFWHADCVALAHVPNAAALRDTLEQLLGPGTVIVDTWTWKVTR